MEIKNLSLTKYKNDILFLPLGGSNEIGLNCNLYHYNGKWIIVDCGVGFVKTVPGVDLIVPDTSFFRKFKDDILGIFLTHIHEDHIGAIQYIWKEIQVPIFTSRFTKYFLYEKLKEYDFYNEVEINEFNEGDKVKIGDFEIESINLTHSTPEMNAMLITTPRGSILNTGDWKFDEDPVIGAKSNIKRLKQLGSQGEILATVCDSTNVFTKRERNSEGELLDSLYNIIKQKEGIVVIATFASNVARIKTISQVAKKTKRQILLVGSSLIRLVKVAREVGFFDESDVFLTEEDLKKDFEGKNLIIISTGCQGERFAGTEKLATDGLRHIHLTDSDCVIFSSSTIPGNERDLLYLYNKFAEKGIEVITDKTDFVHVSGHYTIEDLKNFYDYTKPKLAIAVHGEDMHLLEHQKIARECGIKNITKGQDGVLIKIEEDGKIERIGKLNTKISFVDGKRLLPFGSEIIKARQKMQEVGCVFVNLLVNNRLKLIQEPIISAPGGYDLENDRSTKEIFKEDILQAYNNAIKQIIEIKQESKKRFITEEEKIEFIEQKIRTAVNKIFDYEIGKKPYMDIIFTKLDGGEQQ